MVPYILYYKIQFTTSLHINPCELLVFAYLKNFGMCNPEMSICFDLTTIIINPKWTVLQTANHSIQNFNVFEVYLRHLHN